MEEQGGANLYGFVKNEGINALDPLGLATVRYDRLLRVNGVA